MTTNDTRPEVELPKPVALLERRPRYWGPMATCWECDPGNGWLPNQIGRHIVYSPNTHPYLEYFYVGLVALKVSSSLDGKTMPRVVQPGSNYEIHIYACDSQSVPWINYPPNIIVPQLFAGQWYAADDSHAQGMYHQALMEVCVGVLSILPTEGKNDWVTRFGYHHALVNGMSISDAHRLRSELQDQHYH